MGHGHHDFGERMKIPDYRIYKVADAPEILNIQEVLASKGLKDPWLRNEVWRFRESEWGTHRGRFTTFFLRGFKYGFAAFLVTIAIEKAIDVIGKKKGGGHGGHH
ncbi:NADH dehydrogenase [ubiquinone] 1 beta subcomplex subunit 3 [Halyomorpha halys]|uniref:NADH dehydrogenase [ubiquinone] 1 beta subcomplex subunit 3 n=1 Tax=Halyomorpha halys TaxID=286706 RepID=UPI0006D4FD87|nr:NADH dehydrogenase [ubiquinone] 1 beta subcomplex subunit 3-like [Halyomorpha halys]